ncbi:hypothetical protein [Nocardia xishanensis]|uniref:hypothetical protein n=1 Tax=Nocardia xishanensis TaxID=238964 RepID=UPI00341FB862
MSAGIDMTLGLVAHTSGFSDSPVYRRGRRPEIWIAVHGIGIDIGGGPADLPPGYADLVHARYPRLSGSRALADSVETQALANPRKRHPAHYPATSSTNDTRTCPT